VGDRAPRTIDHIVHAVSDLESAASRYSSLGFTVTPRADHPFGTSNRLVVLEDSYLEIVAVTRPDRIPETGFAARVAWRLRRAGEGISHVVLSSQDPPTDLAELGADATGEIFAFSRPAPQPDGSTIKASFECTLMHGTDDLGMFLCKHLAPTAVWNDTTMHHRNGAHTVVAMTLPVGSEAISVLASAAGVHVEEEHITLGATSIGIANRSRITFDIALPGTDICGVTVAGTGH
jgi:hypothetical protein